MDTKEEGWTVTTKRMCKNEKICYRGKWTHVDTREEQEETEERERERESIGPSSDRAKKR